jgi:integrase
MRVYKRGKRWYLDINFEGRRIRKVIKGARNKTEANAALAAIETDMLRGEFNFKKEKKILFEDFASMYFERHSKLNKRSWRRDICSIQVLSTYFKRMLISSIAAFHIEGYKSHRKKKVKGSTINRELACLKHMFTKAIAWGYVTSNPVKGVRFNEENGAEHWQILTRDQIIRLLTNCKSPMKEIIQLALTTGMRRGEILALKWGDIDFQSEYILVRKSKSGRSRKVPLNDVSLRTLLDLKEENGAFDYVFFNKQTESFLKDPKRAFKTACKKSGVVNLRFHDLRHNAATFMIQDGADIHTVSKILGHSDIRVTMKYSHPDFDGRKKAAKSLENMFSLSEAYGTNMAQTTDQSLAIH